MFLLYQEIDYRFPTMGIHDTRITLINGTSTEVMSREKPILNRQDVTLEESAGGYLFFHGLDSYLCICTDGIFSFKRDHKTGTITSERIFPDVDAFFAAMRATNEVEERDKQRAREILNEAFEELNKPHDFPTVFEYEKFETDEEISGRLNLLNATREEALGKNVYFRKKSTGDLFPPSAAKPPFNTFLTRDGYYLGITVNNRKRFSFVQSLPRHTPSAAQDAFA